MSLVMEIEDWGQIYSDPLTYELITDHSIASEYPFEIQATSDWYSKTKKKNMRKLTGNGFVFIRKIVRAIKDSRREKGLDSAQVKIAVVGRREIHISASDPSVFAAIAGVINFQRQTPDALKIQTGATIVATDT